MQLVYFALQNPGKQPLLKARQQGYRMACQKHRETINAIQRYLPGWMPAFEVSVRDNCELIIVNDSDNCQSRIVNA